MKNIRCQRILAILLAFTMLMSMMLVFTISGSADTEGTKYVLDIAKLAVFDVGAKADGDYIKAGTNDYFTIFYSEKAKVENNEKDIADYSGTRRIAWGAKTEIGDNILNAIKIKTKGSATVRVWLACGDKGRDVAIFDQSGKVIAQTNLGSEPIPEGDSDGIKNNAFLKEFEIPSQGIYYIGNLVGSNYFYYIEVIDREDGTPEGDRADWGSVSAPSISSLADNNSGKILVNVNANVGHNGGDELLVSLYQNGELVATKGSVTEKNSHIIAFTPANSGSYTVKASLLRSGESAKESGSSDVDFVYPLAAPYLSSATSVGGGSIRVRWTHVHEAEGYIIYQNGTEVARIEAGTLSHNISGLTIDSEYNFSVSAIRGNEEKKSNTLSAKATAEEKQEWSFTVYGPSTNSDNNGYIGSLNDDGKVTVYSEGGKGKIQPTSPDGLAFYYTAIPTEYNFTFRAKVTVNSWTFSNGQEGFGLLATDRIGENGNKNNFWTNQYLVGSTKIEYWYNPETEQIFDATTKAGTKYTMKLGIGTIAKTGITHDNLAAIEAGDTDVINKQFNSLISTLEYNATRISEENGLTYNVIGNYTGNLGSTLMNERFMVTELILEIQKNNSGYFLSYYDLDGNLVMTKKHYGADSLNQLDKDFVYVGFFASRNARATFSDVELTTILASEDAPAELPPTTYITPSISIGSADYSTSEDYTLIIDPNVAGTLEVTYDGTVIVEGKYLEALERFKKVIKLKDFDENLIRIKFSPDPDQKLPDFTELRNTKAIINTLTVMYNRGNYHRKTVYISPDVDPETMIANGSKEYPYDLTTALQNACPGQTLVLMEGRYLFDTSLSISRGSNGTAEEPIRLIADPEASTRPVIDFQKLASGFTIAGNYWYFYGFDVTGSMNGQKGIQVSGSYNVLDQIHTYENGNTGLQISRLSGNDLYADWPSYNLILNCTSYRNYDSGFEDADGFAAKLTVGDGNVFDGCVAYNNADDGWDLYAKVETGTIGAVTIRNCIAYENGFVPGIEGKTGNGNGFKMGGESLSGKHVLENSIAFNNLAKGIDSNSCPDIIIKNSIAFNNGSHNVALYTNNAANTNYYASGIISFRTEKLGVEENLKGKGSQQAINYKNDTTYYWSTSGGYAVNTNGEKITADMFVSLEFTGWSRNEDGSINLNGFLQLKDNAPENAKTAVLGGMASATILLPKDEECDFSRSWYNIDPRGHWHYCECGNTSDIHEHEFIWIIDKKVEGNTNGSKHQECTICGYKRPPVTIYPDKPSTPAQPDEPDTPDEPDIPVEPENPDTPEEPAELSFFEMLWKWIVDFFKSLFGIKD